jgi:hypothetical protein
LCFWELISIARFAPELDEFCFSQFASPRHRLPADWLLL